MSNRTDVEGRKGGKGGGGSARIAVEDPNTLRATNIAGMVDLIGEGPIFGLVDGLKSVYFDETPVQSSDGTYNFEGVSIKTRDGTPDQGPLPGQPGIENETDVSVEVVKGTPITRTVTNAEADAVSVRVQVPRLTEQDKENGDLGGSSVTFSFEVKEEGLSWTSIGEFTIEGKTTSPYQRSYRMRLPGVGPTWSIRMSRVSEPPAGAHIANDIYWASYTTIIDAKLSYPDSALIGIEADAQQFGSSIPTRAYHVKGRVVKVPSNYNPSTRQYSGMWNGTFKTAWTDNPAWIYYDVLISTRYGAGQSYVDKWALYEISKYCDEYVPDGYGGQEPRFTCNLVLNTRKDAFEVIDSLSSIFRGMTYWASSQVMPVADMPSDPSKLFTRANVVGDFSYSGTAMKARHSAVLVSWNDPEDFHRQTVEVVEDSEMVEKLGWNQKDVTALGCTSRGQAHRLGKWILYTEKYETELVSFSTGSDAYDLRPGDVINISDPMVVGDRLGGRIVSTGTTELTLDAEPDATSIDWEIDVVMPNGGVETRSLSRFEGSKVTLSQPLSQEPVAGAIWMLRSNKVEPLTFRVLSVSEGEDPLTFEVSALKHEPGKYALVEDGTPLPDREDSLIPSGPLTPPYQITLETYTRLSGGSEQQNLSISWTASQDPRTQQYQVEVKSPSDTAWQQAYLGAGISFNIRDIEAGEWQVRVRGVSGIGARSPWSYRTTNVGGLLFPLPPTSVEVIAKTFTISLRPKGLVSGTQWEYWRSNASLETSMIESNAIRIATTIDLVDSDVEPLTTYFYYIRGVNAYGVSDWYPVQATTEADYETIVGIISGQIKKSDLWPALQEEIGRIDDTSTSLGQLQQEVDDETDRIDDRVDGVKSDLNDEAGRLDSALGRVQTDLSDARESIQQSDVELNDRLDAADAAIVSEREERETEDGVIVSTVDGLVKETGDNRVSIGRLERIQQEGDALEGIIFESLNVESASRKASIRTEESVRIDEDFALAQRSDSLEASLDDQAARITSEEQARVEGDSVLASQVGELSAKVDALPQFASGFEEGADFDQWTGSSLVPETGNVYAGLQSALLTGTASSPIPVGAANAFAGMEVTVRVAATLPPSNASAEFAVRYAPGGMWQAFAPSSTWQVFEFSYVVPEGSSGDTLEIKADTSGSGKAVIIDAVSVKRIAGEILEITAAIETVNQARIDGDEALTQSLTSMRTEVDGNTSRLNTESQTRADETEALSQQTSSLRTDVDGNQSAITDVTQSIADTEEALSTRITGLTARTGQVESGLTSERTARTNADEAFGLRLDSIDVAFDDTTAGLQEEVRVRANETGANAQAIESLTAGGADQQAAIESLRRVNQEGGELEAIQFESINVESANRRASVTTEQQARITETSATAERIDTVQVDLNDEIASVQQQTQASIDEQTGRINAMWTLRTDVSGLVGGIGLANDGETVDFAIRSDVFSIAPPDLPEKAVVPFIFKGGTTYLKEAMINELTFTKLQDGNGEFLVENGKLQAKYIHADDLVIKRGRSDNFVYGKSGWALNPTGGQINFPISFGNIQGGPPANADRTRSNTSADTVKVAGSSAAGVRNKANNGNVAKARTDGWAYPGNATFIDGGKIQANEAWIRRAFIHNAAVDTLQINDQAVTIPVTAFTASNDAVPNNGYGVLQQASINPKGGRVMGTVVFNWKHSGGSAWLNYRIKRNDAVIRVGDIECSFQSNSDGVSLSEDRTETIAFITGPLNGVATFRLEIRDFNSGTAVSKRLINLIAVRK